jgi:cephalosporin hydroxylase
MESLKKNYENYNNEFTTVLLDAENIFNEIYQNCNYTFDKGCGSYLFLGQEYEYCIEMYAKQKLLFDVSKRSNSVLEIGTYMGHSALIMLLANPKLKLTAIDLHSTYADSALQTLKKHFPAADINFIKGSSIDILPTITDKFDLFHIDGDHELNFVLNDFEQTKRLSSERLYKVVFDDWHGERGPGSQLENYVITNNKVRTYFVANCIWPNAYFEINL